MNVPPSQKWKWPTIEKQLSSKANIFSKNLAARCKLFLTIIINKLNILQLFSFIIGSKKTYK